MLPANDDRPPGISDGLFKLLVGIVIGACVCGFWIAIYNRIF